MAKRKPEPTTVYIKGKALRCPVCEGDRFTSLQATVVTRRLAIMHLEWAGQQAQTHSCTRCGYLYWFVPVTG